MNINTLFHFVILEKSTPSSLLARDFVFFAKICHLKAHKTRMLLVQRKFHFFSSISQKIFQIMNYYFQKPTFYLFILSRT